MSTAISTHVNESLGLRQLVNTRIHALLFSEHMTKKELRAHLSLSQVSLSRKLNGHISWTFEELYGVARALNTSLGYLSGETDDPTPSVRTTLGASLTSMSINRE